MTHFVSILDEKLDRISWAGMTALIFVLAIAAIIPAWINYDIIARDGAFQYIPTAKLFYEGNLAQAMSQQQLPFFPFALAVFSLITGVDFEMSGRIVAVIAYVIAAFGMFKAGSMICGNRLCGFISLLFFITNWVVVSTSVDCLQESLQLAFILWANICIFTSITEKNAAKWLYLIAGVLLFIIGSTVRTTTMIFLFAWFLIWVFHKKDRLWLRIGILLLMVFIPLMIVIVFNDLEIFHRKKGFQIYTYLAMAPNLAGKIRSFPDTLGMIFDKGHAILMSLAVIGLIFKKTVTFEQTPENVIEGSKEVSISGSEKGNRVDLINVYRIHTGIVLMLFLTMFFIMGWTTSRYILAPIIWLYPLVACVSYSALKSDRKVIRLFIILTLLSCVAIWGSKSLTPPDPDRVAIRKAGEWIYSELGQDKYVLTNRDRLAFYAKTKFNPLNDIKDIKGYENCIAVDINNDGGNDLIKQLTDKGHKPEKKIGPIYIYLQK
jgi:hypothetical protein